MKYHAEKTDRHETLCGLLTKNSAQFFYSIDQFKKHFNEAHRCKKCAAILDAQEESEGGVIMMASNVLGLVLVPTYENETLI